MPVNAWTRLTDIAYGHDPFTRLPRYGATVTGSWVVLGAWAVVSAAIVVVAVDRRDASERPYGTAAYGIVMGGQLCTPRAQRRTASRALEEPCPRAPVSSPRSQAVESATAGFPGERCLPGRTLILQSDDTQLAAYDLAAALAGEASVARFPLPWPRRFGTCTVSPGLDVAVFAGVHAVRAVDRRGATLWEVRHGCW